MAGVWGMNIESVRALATNFQTQADAVDTVVTTLDPLVGDTSIWMGPDADAFRADWETHKVNLTACATALREAGTKANANAEQQTTASQGS